MLASEIHHNSWIACYFPSEMVDRMETNVVVENPTSDWLNVETLTLRWDPRLLTETDHEKIDVQLWVYTEPDEIVSTRLGAVHTERSRNPTFL